VPETKALEFGQQHNENFMTDLENKTKKRVTLRQVFALSYIYNN